MSALKNVVNPYKSGFGSNAIDTGGSGIFGSFTKEDEAKYNVEMAEAQWLAQLSLIDYQNQYNSPEHQALLMKQAGLNPDLTGLTGVQPSADGSAPSAASPSGSNPTEVIGQAASIFGTVVSLTNSIAAGAVALGGKILDNDIKNLDKVGKTLELGTDIASQIKPRPLEDYSLVLDDGTTVLDASKVVADYPFRNLGASRRNQRNLAKVYERFRQSPMTLSKYYGYQTDVAGKRMKLGEVTSDPRFKSTDEEITEAWRPYTKAMAEMTREMLSDKTAGHRTSRRYSEKSLELGLPEMQAIESYSGTKLQNDENFLMDRLKNPLYKVAENLETKAMEGKQWANYMLIALYTALSAQISASSTNKYGANGSFSENLDISFGGFGF